MSYITPYEYLTKCVMTRLRPSPLHGIGVFAIRDIKKGENVFPYWWGQTGTYNISKSEFDSFSDELQDFIKAMFGYPYKIRLTNACHFVFITPQYFMNTKFKYGTIDCFTYEALTDIAINDELFSNYGENHKHEYKLI